MRRLLPSWLIAALGISVIAAPCTTTGPMQRNFAAGSLVIPMDDCYQKRDSTPPNQTVACNATQDDGVFRAYGLVYFLLKHGVTVYWAVDGATPKTTMVAPDIVVPAPSSGRVASRMSWADGTFGPLDNGDIPEHTGITYIGGPFIIDQGDAAKVVSMLTNDQDQEHADFARFKAEHLVDIHELQNSFTAAQVRPLTGPPPKIAILNINPNDRKTSVNVMYEYAVAAGLSWPCTGNGDCAGGVTGNGVNRAGNLGQGCDLPALYAYLNNNGDVNIPRQDVNGGSCQAGEVCAPTFNASPGQVYDILCDNDFYAQSGQYVDTMLAKGGYKLLWAPHWEEGTQPSATPSAPPSTAGDILGLQLQAIRSFVEEGNNLFAECHAIVTLEGGTGTSGTEYGLDITRFQSGVAGGMTAVTPLPAWGGQPVGASFLDDAYADPKMQVGDFVYRSVAGSVPAYLPDLDTDPAPNYKPGVVRLAYQTDATGLRTIGNGNTQSFSPSLRFDLATSKVLTTSDGGERGTITYLGGHRYQGQTAGTRIVLNTLFDQGFACQDPNTTCNVPGKQGACAQGTLKCASGGNYKCEPPAGFPTAKDNCDGTDSNCNGIIDDGCNQAECTSGQTRPCYSGTAGCTQNQDGSYTCGGLCKAGTQTCTGGFWGGCEGQLLPAPEVCNGKDDDCNGQVDDGDLCGGNRSCQSGICLPTTCNGENAHCPEGFTCSSDKCTAIACGGGGPCQAPQVCISGACKDPCDGVTCGSGSACSGGSCTAGGCALAGCPSGQACVNGSCVTDPCNGISCPTGTFCRLGDCVRSCSYVDCPPGSTCDVDGFCSSAACSPACESGQKCLNGTCVADPCAGINCAVTQVCQDGVCVDDLCAHVTCPAGTCQAGQCMGANAVTSQTTKVSSDSGGCGSSRSAGLGSVALLLVLLWRRRSSSATPGRRTTAALAASAALAAGLSSGGCSKSSTSCHNGQTACGSACVDLAASGDHCGVCGRKCSEGSQCSAGACVYPTPNPFLKTVTPSALSLGSKVPLQLTGSGFEQGAILRVSGAGITTRELGLTVDAAGTSATSDTLDLSGVPAGTLDVRVANPGQPEPGVGRFISNALQLSVNSGTILNGIDPPNVKQDQGGTVTLTLTGVFQQGAAVALQPSGGTVRNLDATFVDASTLTVGIQPSTLAVGTYSLTVTNPGSTAASLPFPVIEGQPTLTSITPCGKPGASFDGTVEGTYLYPKSAVTVTGGGADSVLPSQCLLGTDDLGQCKDGKLRVQVTLPLDSAGTYDVTVVNPGSQPSNALQFTVKLDCQL